MPPGLTREIILATGIRILPSTAKTHTFKSHRFAFTRSDSRSLSITFLNHQRLSAPPSSHFSPPQHPHSHTITAQQTANSKPPRRSSHKAPQQLYRVFLYNSSGISPITSPSQTYYNSQHAHHQISHLSPSCTPHPPHPHRHNRPSNQHQLRAHNPSRPMRRFNLGHNIHDPHSHRATSTHNATIPKPGHRVGPKLSNANNSYIRYNAGV